MIKQNSFCLLSYAQNRPPVASQVT